MHWRFWGIFVVFLALVATSCRKTVDPNTDRNRAPETYLTAAPIDSIAGGPLNRVPYRYHAHWSGSDVDGEVVGFFVAVTETIPRTGPTVVRLPPPKPQDYKFTTRTDSIFIFNIHEGLGSDREHGLFVFAVDNEGKVDPDPAFVNFVARDRNLPGIIWEEAFGEGTVFEFDAGGNLVPVPFFRQLKDGESPVGARFAPLDTVPVGAAAQFAWRGFDRDWNSQIRGYQYKLIEPEFVRGDSTKKSVEYNTGAPGATTEIPVGLNLFRVRAVDEAGGTTFPDSLRRFVVNFDPDTWWAGPSPNDPAIAPLIKIDERGRYLEARDNVLGLHPEVLDPWLGEERFDVLPAERGQSRTFLEKTRRGQEFRWYIRSVDDTVARNAEAIYLFAGGFDRDSPYTVIVNDDAPPTQLGRVPVPTGPNGSPIGVEFRIVRQFTDMSRNNPSFTKIFPNFDPLSPSFNPDVFLLEEVNFDQDSPGFTGSQFAQVRSVDGSLGRDRRIRDALQHVQMFTGTPLDSLVMFWHQNLRPFFLTDVPSFVPDADTLVTDPNFTARLFMTDPDSTSGFSRAPFLVRVRFREPGDNPAPNVGWQPAEGFRMFSGETFPMIIPPTLTPGRAFFEFELSDQPVTDDLRDRRIIRVQIPFFWQVSS